MHPVCSQLRVLCAPGELTALAGMPTRMKEEGDAI